MSAVGNYRAEELNPPGDWARRAACRGQDPDLFFPERGDQQTYAVVRAICGGCEVRQDCLDYATSNHIHDGWWGGLSEKERKRLRSKRHRDGLAGNPKGVLE